MNDTIKTSLAGPGYRVRPSQKKIELQDQRMFETVAKSPVLQNRAVMPIHADQAVRILSDQITVVDIKLMAIVTLMQERNVFTADEFNTTCKDLEAAARAMLAATATTATIEPSQPTTKASNDIV